MFSTYQPYFHILLEIKQIVKEIEIKSQSKGETNDK